MLMTWYMSYVDVLPQLFPVACMAPVSIQSQSAASPSQRSPTLSVVLAQPLACAVLMASISEAEGHSQLSRSRTHHWPHWMH